MKRYIALFFILVSSTSVAAIEATRGEGLNHGEGATFCDQDCQKNVSTTERYEKPMTEEERQREVFCISNRDQCSKQELKRFGYK